MRRVIVTWLLSLKVTVKILFLSLPNYVSRPRTNHLAHYFKPPLWYLTQLFIYPLPLPALFISHPPRHPTQFPSHPFLNLSLTLSFLAHRAFLKPPYPLTPHLVILQIHLLLFNLSLWPFLLHLSAPALILPSLFLSRIQVQSNCS